MMAILGTFRTDVDDFVRLNPQVRFLLVFQLIILFVLSILMGVIFSPRFKSNVQMRSGIKLDTTPTQAPKSRNTISIVPAAQSAVIGAKQRVDVIYSGDSAEVIDTVINYDPKQVKVDLLKNGGIYDQVLQTKIENKRISFSAGFSLDNLKKEIPSTSGVLYSFTITPLPGAQKIELSFVQPETFVWHTRANIIEGFTNASIPVTQK